MFAVINGSDTDSEQVSSPDVDLKEFGTMKIKGKRVVVTGGAGFVGSHLVDCLSQENHVLVVDDFSSGTEENLAHQDGNERVRVVRADVRSPSDMETLTQGANVIFHLAVRNLRESIRNPVEVNEVNVSGTIHLCQAALCNRVERFVYVSSSEIYGSGDSIPITEDFRAAPSTPYGASKLAGEAYTLSFFHTYGLPGSIVRPFNCFGPRGHYLGKSGEVIPRFILRAMNGSPLPVFGDGLQTRGFSYVEDIAKGIIEGAQCDALVGRPVNVASGQEASVLEVGGMILDILGGGACGFVHHPERPGDIRCQCADISLASRSFRFEPRVGIREGIEKQIRWMQAQNLLDSNLFERDPVFNWEDPVP